MPGLFNGFVLRQQQAVSADGSLRSAGAATCKRNEGWGVAICLCDCLVSIAASTGEDVDGARHPRARKIQGKASNFRRKQAKKMGAGAAEESARRTHPTAALDMLSPCGWVHKQTHGTQSEQS